MKTLSKNELESFFNDIESDYDVRLPVRLQDGTRTLGKLGDGAMSLCGGVPPVKITSVFFPQNECILSVKADEIQMQRPISKPILLVGLTAADADCLEFVDRFFSTNYRDDIYFNKRDGAAIFCISGWSGLNGGFMRISGGKCDVELIYDRSGFIIKTYTQTGRALVRKMPSGSPAVSRTYRKLKDISQNLPKDDETLIQTASRLILDGKVPEKF